ncbi:MAG: hypothetical protein EHM58_04840 [Ignavibacteriae bacterium]|nr:MAG: hypothetical protein EHM58_04840 [Ignavibacteriota bacterium]
MSFTQFFTVDSMLTLTGAAGAVYLICNGMQNALNFNPKWLGLVLSLFLSFAGIFNVINNDNTIHLTFLSIVVGLVNGFLIFATASGGNSLTSTSQGSKPPGKEGIAESKPGESKRSFFTSWNI